MRYLDAAIERTGKPLVSIVDLGGTGSFWKMNLRHLVHANRIQRIDVYNLDVHSEGIEQLGDLVVREAPGDATELPNIGDGAYDVAFSNSVIEHVGNFNAQNRFAREIRRIARYHVVQTPSRYFPLEPHFYVPFFQFMPLALRAALHRRSQLGWFAPEPDPLQARIDCDQIRLLGRRELRLLFPSDEIHREWLGGLVKSFVVVGASGT